ncbi:MAG: Calx-beta domain-containing protein [Bacteroidota bacterium]
MKKILPLFVGLFSATQSFGFIWTVNHIGTSYNPDSITIIQGDTVEFQLDPSHDALEVDQATWNSFGSAPLSGGFNVPFGGGSLTGLSAGTHYYICTNHIGSGMRGRIVVQAQNPSVEFILTSSSVSEGVGSFQLALSIVNPNSNPTSVDLNVLGGGTAIFGTDFLFSPLTITFPANSAFTQNLTVTIADDIITEGNESFTFQLNFPTNNASIGTNSQHMVTILDNDILQFDINPRSQTISENAGTLNIPINLSNISGNNTSVTVHLETSGTTAIQDTDFVFSDTTLIWPAGSTGSISVPIIIMDDTLYEPNETVKLRLINPSNGATLLNDTFLLVIQNNDIRPLVNCADLFFSEYIEGSGNNRAIEIFNPTSLPVNLNEYRIYKSNDGGTSSWTFDLTGLLAPGASYVGAHDQANGQIAAVADTLSVFFDFSGNDALILIHLTDTIDILGQMWIDPRTAWPLIGGSTQDHTLIRSYYTYTGQTNWSIASTTWDVYPNEMFDSLGFHHIAPCGTPEPIYPSYIHFTVASDTVSESDGTVQVIVQIENPDSTYLSYFLARDDNSGTTSAGLDYTFTNHNFSTNKGGVTFDTVTIKVLEDQLVEPTEKVVLHFLNLTPGVTPLQDSLFTLYITDNDVLTSSFLGAGFSYVEKDTTVGVKVFLSTFPDTTASVRIRLAPGNAIAGNDYTFSDTVLVFPVNSTDTQVAWITIIDDQIAEPNEQINFDLTETSGLPVWISAYTLTIIDDDSDVGISQLDLENTFRIFPNPVQHTLYIHSDSDLSKTEITDLVGNLVVNTGSLLSGKSSIDVSSLPAGMYFMNVREEQRAFSRRFIKQD